MQTSTDIMGMFSYSIIPTLAFIVLLTVLIVLSKFNKEKKVEEIVIMEPNEDLKAKIKSKYLKLIDELIDNAKNNAISNRKAFQKLSVIIRSFIFEMTNIKVHNYTLSDIDKEKMPVLYELVSEYYDPEFSVNSGGNILESIDKTKKVIEKWN